MNEIDAVQYTVWIDGFNKYSRKGNEAEEVETPDADFDKKCFNLEREKFNLAREKNSHSETYANKISN